MVPTDYIEYIRACPEEASTEELQMIYTWYSGLTKGSFKMRCFLRRQIENRVASRKEVVFRFNEEKYLEDMAEAAANRPAYY